MNFIIVPGILVCSSFLISVCMFIALKVLLILSAIANVRAGRRGIWVSPFATVLFNVFSVSYVCCYVRRKALLQCLYNF